MIVAPDYRGFRIEANAAAEGERWNAEVRILKLFSRVKPHVEMVTCYNPTPEHADRAGVLWARRRVDAHGVPS